MSTGQPSRPESLREPAVQPCPGPADIPKKAKTADPKFAGPLQPRRLGVVHDWILRVSTSSFAYASAGILTHRGTTHRA